MKTVICFGDSNTYGYDPRSYLGGRYGPDSRWVDLLAARTGWDVRNQGQNGRTIPGGPVPFPADTDLLTVMLGTNDLLQGRGPETAAERMFRLRFSFKNQKYDNKKPYYLVAYDDKNSVEVLRRQVVMDIAMADDFGFGF